MRTWKKLAAIFLVVMVLVVSLNGCSNSDVHMVDSETEEILNDCRLEVANYFSNKDIDISEKLSKLQNTYIYNSNDSEIAGFYETGSFDIYLDSNTILDIDYLKFVYIHQLMHYLGFTDDETTMMQEGMADAITEDILGYAYESYDIPRFLCHQLIIADPEIFSYVIEGGDLDNRIDKSLQVSKSSAGKYSIKFSIILDLLLNNLQLNADNIDTYTIIQSVIQCQAIVSAYCNTFDLTDNQKDALSQYIINFDLTDEELEEFSQYIE